MEKLVQIHAVERFRTAVAKYNDDDDDDDDDSWRLQWLKCKIKGRGTLHSGVGP